jgi:hypothetical protein
MAFDFPDIFTREHVMHPFRTFVVQNKASVWIAFCIAIVAATMMHPTFASVLSIIAIGALLCVLRWVAHMEGRAMAVLDGDVHRSPHVGPAVRGDDPDNKAAA